jgi:hypothetical protein
MAGLRDLYEANPPLRDRAVDLLQKEESHLVIAGISGLSDW